MTVKVGLFTDLQLEHSINTSDDELIDGFFVPILKRSKMYDRGVGFFSSGWLRMASEGMISFAQNEGRARWVTSPILSKNDWEAMKLGEVARQDILIRNALEREVNDFAYAMEERTRSALAWMIAEGIITIRLALPRNKLEGGEFHDKFGIFTDAWNNKISFNGSYNDSIQGLRNYEAIKVFWNWDPDIKAFVDHDVGRFNSLWNNQDINVETISLPEAIKKKITRYMTTSKPFASMNYDAGIASELIETSSEPSLPSEMQLRSYQEDAIEAWRENGYRGILEMATGTGKTITALASMLQLLMKENRLIIVISCPYKHLVNQWAKEASRFKFQPIEVVESSRKWGKELAEQLNAYDKKLIDVVMVITTNTSFKSDLFNEQMHDKWDQVALVIDEAHNAGSSRMLASLPQTVQFRMGLSATPIRQYDEDGTQGLLDYFTGLIFSFGLEEAIGEYLTPYYYYPIPVEMTEEEFEDYIELTRRLNRLRGDPEEPISDAALMVAIQRARIQNNSISKLRWLDENIEAGADISFTLFYVGERLFAQTLKLLGSDKRIRIHEFTQNQTNKQREDLLSRFASGDLQALVAMKCLDEGVDIPQTRNAYFLASSSVSREFIQRRGRVLRKAEGKEHARLYDLISTPPRVFTQLGKSSADYAAVRAAFGREYRRLKEFANLSMNKYEALEPFFKIASSLDLITF